jgi:hypothetical protein
MTEHSTHAIPTDVLTAHLEGEAVLLDMVTRKYFQLNGTAAKIWKYLERGTDRRDLVTRLCSEYDVEPGVAETELGRILDELTDRGLLRVTGSGGA